MAALPATTTAAAAGSAQAQDSGVQYVNAVADASLVHLKVKWKGWVAVPRETFLWGTSADYWSLAEGIYGPYSVTTTCSGFIASPTGDVVTAGHCVDDQTYDGGKRAILSAFVADLGEALFASPAEMDQAMASLQANADIEGLDAGSPPEREVRVTAPALARRSYPASVLDVQSFRNGDVAVLNVTGLEGPVLQVADAAPESGVSVIAAGFSGGMAQVVDSNSPPTFNAGTISGTETINGTPFTSLSSRTSPGMSGGPVLDMEGMVVGTVSWALSSEADRSSDFMAAAPSIQSILAGNGIDNTLGEADQAWRDGLQYFYESRYHDAVAKFDEARDLQPGWKFMSEYRHQAVASYPDDVNPPETADEGGGGGGGLPTWSYIVIGAVVLLGAGGLALVLRRRHARPHAAGPASQPIPPGPAGPPGGPEVGTVPTAPVTPPVVTARFVSAPPPPAPAPAPVATDVPTGHGFCPNCGTKHDLEAHYCEGCGQPFEGLPPQPPRETVGRES